MAFTHDFPFDPTYGYEREALLRIKAPPTEKSDFDDFWRTTYEATLSVPVRAELRESKFIPKNPIDFFDLKEIFFDTLQGLRVGAWLYVPKKGKPHSMTIHAHGYGGPGDPAAEKDGGIHLMVHAPGFGLSASPSLPNESSAHVIHGIHSKETYLIRFCVAALWSAVTFLRERFPELKSRLFLKGTSFGGGLGALALPWDKRVVRAQLVVPTFGHHPIRLTCPCNGSGESVRKYHASHPEVVDVLSYFDAASTALRIETPMLMVPALFDPAVPPPGQFAVANAAKGPKEMFILSAGHFTYADEIEEYRKLAEISRRWFE
ncbi:MAG: acetylxylan esterase [Spirochaetia bacterium]|nr:acetylxylan esterase [Spirochaetia bacterium]